MTHRHLVGVQSDLFGAPDVPVFVPVPKAARQRIRIRARAAGAPTEDDLQGRVLVALQKLECASTTSLAKEAGLTRAQVKRQMPALVRLRKAAKASCRYPTSGGGHEVGWIAL